MGHEGGVWVRRCGEWGVEGASCPGVRSAHSHAPYCRSNRHVWHTFFTRAHIWQITVLFSRAFGPGFHLYTVKGRSQVLQAPPAVSSSMRT
jgi:hypothetical protein